MPNMPSKDQHLAQAHHNEEFVAIFNLNTTPYIDWMVAGLFYAALHYIDSFLALHGIHPSQHDVRDGCIIKVRDLSPIWIDYRHLKDDRRAAQYDIVHFRPKDISNNIRPKFEAIKEFILSKLT